MTPHILGGPQGTHYRPKPPGGDECPGTWLGPGQVVMIVAPGSYMGFQTPMSCCCEPDAWITHGSETGHRALLTTMREYDCKMQMDTMEDRQHSKQHGSCANVVRKNWNNTQWVWKWMILTIQIALKSPAPGRNPSVFPLVFRPLWIVKRARKKNRTENSGSILV